MKTPSSTSSKNDSYLVGTGLPREEDISCISTESYPDEFTKDEEKQSDSFSSTSSSSISVNVPVCPDPCSCSITSEDFSSLEHTSLDALACQLLDCQRILEVLHLYLVS